MTFKLNDLVQVAKDLGPSRKHFESDCHAIIAEVHSGGTQYGLYLEHKGYSAWYRDEDLTLIANDQEALLKEWEATRQARALQQSDLDWIFLNGNVLLTEFPGPSIEALAKTLGITNLWGAHGEGFTYYVNAMTIIDAAAPYLKTGDRAGWEAFALRNQQ